MAAGDFIVRRNNANTDTIPNNGSGSLDLLWDTAVDNQGSTITYNVSNGEFTLTETGYYLVLYSERWECLDTTTNERRNAKTTLNLAGAELNEGYAAGFIRAQTTASKEFINSGAAIIKVATANDKLKIVMERIDDSTTGTADRVGNDRNGITIVRLDDSLNYSRYTGSVTTSVTDNAALDVIDTTVEENSPFTRTSGDIDIATNNLVLAIYSLKSEDTTPGTVRTEYQGRLTLAGTVVPGSYSQTYIRVNDNCDWGGMSNACLLEPTSGDDLTLEIVSREAGGLDFEGSLQLIELPTSAKAIIVEATSGNFNPATTSFAWDTNPYIDTDVFTHTAGQADLDVDTAGDYLVFASQAATSYSALARSVPVVSFAVNGTEQQQAGGSSYGRGSGTAGFPAVYAGTLLTGLSANDSITAYNDLLSTAGTITCNVGGMSVIQLSSLSSGDISVNASGSVGTGSLGTVTVNFESSISITGLSSTGSVGTSTVTGDASISISGESSTLQLGLASAVGDASVSVSGNQGSGAVGTATAVVPNKAEITWVEFEIPEAGASTPINVNATGVQSTSGLGSVTINTDWQESVTGVSSSGAVGTASIVTDVNESVSGLSTSALLNSVITNFDFQVTSSGVSSSSSVGTVDINFAWQESTTGVSSSSNLGTVIAQSGVSESVTGISATTQIGTATVEGDSVVSITGISATGALGTIEGTGTVNVSVSGVSSSGLISSANTYYDWVESAVGVSSTSQIGTATISSEVIEAVSGISATVFLSTVLTNFDWLESVSGVESTAQIGIATVSSQVNTLATGVSSTIQLGTTIQYFDWQESITGVSSSSQLGVAVASTDHQENVIGISATSSIGFSWSETTHAFMFPDGDITDGSWTTELGSQVDLYSSIDEIIIDDNDYIQSSVAPVDDMTEVSLGAPTTTPIIDSGHYVQYRYKKEQNTGIVNLTANLVQGTTTIASWTHNNIGSTLVTANQALTTGQASNITDYTDLRIRFSATQE